MDIIKKIDVALNEDDAKKAAKLVDQIVIAKEDDKEAAKKLLAKLKKIDVVEIAPWKDHNKGESLLLRDVVKSIEKELGLLK